MTLEKLPRVVQRKVDGVGLELHSFFERKVKDRVKPSKRKFWTTSQPTNEF